MDAEKVELGNLQEISAYEIVPDEGQHRISCRLVLWHKAEEIRARLTHRGFEEKENVASDSPIIDKCNVRLVFAICESKAWVLETSSVKSAFIQDHDLDRDIYIQPPVEAGVSRNRLWKLNNALHRLDDSFSSNERRYYLN